jgi:hypothetical protein
MFAFFKIYQFKCMEVYLFSLDKKKVKERGRERKKDL